MRGELIVNPSIANENLRPAENLSEVYWTFGPDPLRGALELKAFYRSELNAIRGEDVVRRLALRLRESVGRGPYKAFLVGQPGSGKSTEISRLVEAIGASHRVLRLSAADEVNPATFEPFDILLLILFRLAEAMKQVLADFPEGGAIPEELLQEMLRFFGDEEKSTTTRKNSELHAEAKAGVGFPRLWASFLKFTAEAGGKIKVGYQQEKKLVDYRFQRLGPLSEITNRFVMECDRLLEELDHRQWLIVVEDFDRSGISAAQLRKVLIEYGGLFKQLHISLLFTIPAWLAYSREGERLPFDRDHRFILTDTPVFRRDHGPDAMGRDSLRAVVLARAKEELFGEGSLDMLIVASGGNLRDLFAMTREAADLAALRGDARMTTLDAKKAIQKTVQLYRNRLGTSAEEPDAVPYEQLRAKLLQIYRDEALAQVPDAALYALLRSRAVLHFNGESWFGVHTVVVDILKEQELLAQDDPGGTI
jgi:hypothetical protein